MPPRTGQVLDYAAAEARRYGRTAVGTEHLLFGVSREGGSLGSWLLIREGVHPVVLGPELGALLPEGAAARFQLHPAISATRAVNSVNGLAWLGYWWGFLALLTLDMLQGPPSAQLLWPCFVRAVWASGLALASVRSGLRLERRVWPRMQALLFASTAGAAAILTAAVTGLVPSFGRASWLFAVYLAFVGYVTVTMFRSRTWFGVEPREGWRTLWREGRVYLVVSAILELATLAGYVLHG